MPVDEEPVARPEKTPGFLQRRSTRRAVVMGTAGIAAAGATAAVIGLTAEGGAASPVSGDVERTALLSTTPAAPATPRPSSTAVVTDARLRAAHLLRRAGFGGSLAEIEEFAGLSREEAVSQLVDFDQVDNSALDARITAANFQLTYTASARGQLIADMQKWWLTRMAYTARPLEERLTLIWHSLLTSQISKIGGQRASWMVWQNELFRKHAAGRFDDLVQAVAKDPAMMMYLDSVESSKEHPNENFPRELMELYTMGEGNYSEDDVRESARAFTGWRLSRPPFLSREERAKLSDAERLERQMEIISTYRPDFVFDAREHDSGEKTFLGKTGMFNGEDIIAIIMEQAATGRYVCARLWSELAYADPEPELIERFEGVWKNSGHSIREVVRAILLSDEFYSERAYRGKVRSPVELLVGLVRGTEIDLSRDVAIAGGAARTGRSNFYSGMDQVLFEPPNVAGWAGGTGWLSSSTFFARANFLDEFLFPRGRGVVTFPALAGLPADAMVSAAADRLVDGDLAAASRTAISVLVDGIRNPDERAATAVYLVAASPEFQLI
ncbi:MAG: DUF1800 domain-containing protein [Dehalococcoidia bacterium]|nr:DUF1800 domain-containing protein [Dehalococcoidia bacterium]MCB9486187.1 DUF1800 domain-containing protein [Thermoflexaceae bacterium]